VSGLDWSDGDPIDMPLLDTEEGRDAWIDFLANAEPEGDDEWSKAIVVVNDNDMVMRIRYPDGNEEVFDVLIRRSMEIVKKAPDGATN